MRLLAGFGIDFLIGIENVCEIKCGPNLLKPEK
ncbi:MAG: hypothetical protein ACJAYY_002691 [Paraglaciecola sp.]|jgi:hypothetical protein